MEYWTVLQMDKTTPQNWEVLGHPTENSVRIQISAAIISYCLVAIARYDMKLERSTYEVLQIISISLTDKTRFKGLFEKINFYDVKELNSSLFSRAFD